jgi:hypothetical protein
MHFNLASPGPFYPSCLESGVVAIPVDRSKLKLKGHPVQDLGILPLNTAGFVLKDRFFITYAIIGLFILA